MLVPSIETNMEIKKDKYNRNVKYVNCLEINLKIRDSRGHIARLVGAPRKPRL